jgi:hypothetical protein
MVVCRSTPAKCHFFIAVKDGSRNPSPVQDYRYINDTFIGTAEDLFVNGQNNGMPTLAWWFFTLMSFINFALQRCLQKPLASAPLWHFSYKF